MPKFVTHSFTAYLHLTLASIDPLNRQVYDDGINPGGTPTFVLAFRSEYKIKCQRKLNDELSTNKNNLQR